MNRIAVLPPLPSCVKAVATLGEDQSFPLFVRDGEHVRHPSFDVGLVTVRKGQVDFLKRLGAVPDVLRKLRQINEQANDTRS